MFYLYLCLIWQVEIEHVLAHRGSPDPDISIHIPEGKISPLIFPLNYFRWCLLASLAPFSDGYPEGWVDADIL